ncbi:hemerythrin domain-containing protein [Paenibacillus sp. SI8]|uniref:hemerythrin domain-containing protein n=1 Tax=unclassified Paenibacillus TaxID=185978 RepID=UPI0034664ADF
MVVELRIAIERLKDEHSALKKELEDVQLKTSHMLATLGTDESMDLLRELRRQMISYMKLIQDHEHWEEEEIFPVLERYANQGMDPSFITSKWVMEEDHKQAERFVRSFVDYADPSMAADSVKLKKAISLLSMACSAISEHLLTEEEMFFPIADQVLDEMQD